jgi:superfamily I DNA/RNA helicase
VKDGNDFISTTENFRKVFKQRDGITISTIHGVKGAEFNTVIAFALLQDYVPHSGDTDENAAQKLLYVISSRAIKNLHLISEKGRFRNWGDPPEEYVPTYILNSYDYDYQIC